MSTLTFCPECEAKVGVPDGTHPSAQVRCPLCGHEFTLGESVPDDVPELIVVDPGLVETADESAAQAAEGSDGEEVTCGCGQTGCIETWLNGAALSRDYFAASGRTANAEEIARLAEEKDEQARHAISLYEKRLARALAAAINFLDPDVVVLGGGISAIPSLYAKVPRLWSRYASSGAMATRLVEAKYGPDSGVRGAAWL